MDPGQGFEFGLLIAAFWFGFRHGIDFDHIAAIADITSSVDDRKRAVWFGTLYAVGHALVVLALGMVAILAGDLIPAGIDEFMTRVVGVTLLVLGVYVIVSLVRHGRDFRLRSRWMLIFEGIRRGTHWVRRRAASRRPVPVPVPAGAPGSSGTVAPADVTLAAGSDAALWHHGHHGRPGHHHHDRPERDDQLTYGRATAFGVGMIHGVGAETPTQVLIFLAAAGAGGVGVGVTVLVAFLVGLLASNSLITVGSAFGFLHASKNFGVYATVAVLTAVFSLVLGLIFVLNRPDVLPPLLGG
jgi:hypothetical protein